MSRTRSTHAFTLVEILIVVVILGILAAVVVPSMASASEEAAVGTTRNELVKLERAVEVYLARNENAIPTVTAGDGTWGQIVSRDYLKEAPINPYVGGVNSRTIIIRDSPDTTFASTHGWIFDSNTGQVWAAGFDANDQPLPRN